MIMQSFPYKLDHPSDAEHSYAITDIHSLNGIIYSVALVSGVIPLVLCSLHFSVFLSQPLSRCAS
jgi:hypothetical protein